MAKWEKWLDDGSAFKTSKKIDKNTFCKKNKLDGHRYGPHLYDNNDEFCVLCRHRKKKPSYLDDLINDFTNEQMEKKNNENNK